MPYARGLTGDRVPCKKVLVLMKHIFIYIHIYIYIYIYELLTLN